MIKSCIAVILFLSMMFKCDAQQDYLVLIDAENNQPFYARFGEKTFSSSPVGHLSIPHLKDSVYAILIGFPQNQYPEQLFSIKVNKKDKGFRLRNLGDKGWALFNWQTQELKMSQADTSKGGNSLEMGVKKDDAFSRLMADVVNDSLVMYNTYILEPEHTDSAKKMAEELSVNADRQVKRGARLLKTEAVNTAGEAILVKKENPVKKEGPDKKASIVKLKSVRLKEGWRLTYIDFDKNGHGDTIQLIIPYETPAPVPVVTAAVPKTDSIAKPAKDTTKTETVAVVKARPPAVNPACKEMASDYDIDVVRVNILTEETQEKKLAAAKRSLKSKCITVKQIRALSELFVSDSTRYDFFEAMYPSVQDRDNFLQLADLLIDRLYNSRFKTKFTQ